MIGKEPPPDHIEFGASQEGDASAGLTLIELLIVIAVLGIIAAVVVFALGKVTSQSAVAACNADAKTVETAMAAYNAEMGGTPTVTAEALTTGTTPYLKSFPSSPYYTISIVNGVVMVAAPPTTPAAAFDTADPCGNAGGVVDADASSTTTTVAPPTTTSTAVQSTTTTTSDPPSTTTTTTTMVPSTTTTSASPTNGVSVTPASDQYSDYGGQETLTITAPSSISAMSITISVSKTTGVTHNSQGNSFPGGALKQSSKTSGGVVSYTSLLKAGQTIPAAYSNGSVYAQFNGNGHVHSMSGDQWTVTTTSRGIVSTLTGIF